MSSLKVLVLVDLAETPPGDHDYSHDLQDENWKSEADVLRALRALGHVPRLFGLHDSLDSLVAELRRDPPDVVFNLAEAFRGDRSLEAELAAFLTLQGVRYTGARPEALAICKDKALAKKIVAYHGVKIPDFAVAPRALGASLSDFASFPAIVKPLNLESSTGIARASIVQDRKQCLERIAFIHERFGCDAIVEEFVEGREIYVGALGRWNGKTVELFPPRELFFESVPEGDPKLATFKAKWDDEYRQRWGIRNGMAKDLAPATLETLEQTCRSAFRALKLSGYARLDLRLTAEGSAVFIEANPNPSVAAEDDFAQAAAEAGWNYQKLIAAILESACS